LKVEDVIRLQMEGELEFSVGDWVYLKVQPYRLKPLAR